MAALDDVYEQLKNLEDDLLLGLPPRLDTIPIGTLDAAKGSFSWAVPTMIKLLRVKPTSGGPDGGHNTMHPVPPKRLTVGIAITTAARLLLRFDVLGQTTAATEVDGFPTVESAVDHIIVDAAHAASAPNGLTETEDPAVSTFRLALHPPGHNPLTVDVLILRSPAVGIGAFTIEALPMAVIYAPPQGAYKKNYSTYSQAKTLTTSLTTSLVNGSSTKTATAYTPQQLLDNIGGALGSITALIGGIPTGGSDGPGLLAGIIQKIEEIAGKPKTAAQSLSATAAEVKNATDTASKIISALDGADSTSSTNALSNEQDQTITRSTTISEMLPSGGGDAGQLPSGPGDRITYLQNVRCFWGVVNGQVAISVLGTGSLSTDSVQGLQDALAAVEAGEDPPAGFPRSADAIRSLLQVDPWLAKLHAAEPPSHRFAAPRFVPALVNGSTTNEVHGSGTGPANHDTYTITVDTKTDNKLVTVGSSSSVTDLKPGWLPVLFDTEDNIETTNTTSLISSTTVDTTTDTTITCTLNMYSRDETDPYDIKLFTDLLFGTYVIADAHSISDDSGVVPTGVHLGAIHAAGS